MAILALKLMLFLQEKVYSLDNSDKVLPQKNSSKFPEFDDYNFKSQPKEFTFKKSFWSEYESKNVF